MTARLAAAAPHALPYLAFLGVVEVARWAPGDGGWALPWKVALPGLLFLGFLVRGHYPELGGGRRLARGLGLDVALGLGIAALWTLPYLAFDALPRPEGEAGFDPSVLGSGREAVALGLRAAGFALVTPFVEELFVRSLVWRWLAAGAGGDFRRVAAGAPSARAAVGTTIVFTITHVPWEWPVALPTGALLAGWLLWRRHLGACVVAHAVANATILGLAWVRPGTFGFFL